MDYDDNDTQGHNLQLAGEGRSKSSSALRPYAFPRFDFDDSIQGHLRFDNLVETEVFLGIQSQEDNQWIEDFSRGSNVIEFSSGANESCSIARRHNVWSEATSSESVEMLLKSVGQEHSVPKDCMSESSKTCNELGDLTKRMEPKFEQDNIIDGCTGTSDSTIPQNELLDNIPELESHGGELSQVEETSFPQADSIKEDKGPDLVCSKNLEEECRATAAEEDLLPVTECDGKNKQGVECPVQEPVMRAEVGLSYSPFPATNVNSGSEVIGPFLSPDQVSKHGLEGTDDLVVVADGRIEEQLPSREMADADSHIMERHKVEHTMHNEEVPHSFSLITQSVYVGAADEVFINSNESSEMSCKLEGRSRDSLAPPSLEGERQAEILSNSAVMTASLVGNDSEVQATKLTSPISEHHSGSEKNIDSVPHLDHELSAGKGDNVAGGSDKVVQGDVVGSPSQLSLTKVEHEHSINKINNAGIADLGESLGFPALPCSAELIKGTGGVKTVEDLRDTSMASVGESLSFGGSGEGFEQKVGTQLSDACEPKHISFDVKKEDRTSLSTDVDPTSETGVALTSDHRVGSSTMSDHTSHDETMDDQPNAEIASKMEPETGVIPCGGSIDVQENNEGKHEQSFGREHSRTNEKEESGGRTSVDFSLSSLDGSDQLEAKVGSACKDKLGVCHDSTASQLTNTDGKHIPVMKACNNVGGSETRSLSSGECWKALEAHPGSTDSLLNKGDAVEGLSSDAEKVACNSPTIISSTALSPDESKIARVVASEFSENKASTSEHQKVMDGCGDDNSFTFKVNSLPEAEREKANNWAPFPTAETLKSPKVMEGVTVVDAGRIQARSPQEASGHTPGGHAYGTPKTNSGRKRRVSGKGVAGENPQKEVTPDKRPQKGDRVLGASLSPGSSLPGRFAILQSHGLTEQRSRKQSTRTAVSASSLPDLNASSLKSPASPSVAFRPPFTDLQQVQLRAQIFVYGSLIQGTAPDEAFMASAFGPDRGRIVWEPLWKAAVERVRCKKFHSGGESVVNSHSAGFNGPDVDGKQASPQSKVFQSPASQAVNKGTPTTIPNPMIPLSSPLWSFSTPYRDGSQSSSLQRRPVFDYQPAGSAVHPYNTPTLRNIISHTTWPSQPPCSPNPWASQSSSLNAQFSTIPIIETVKLTPVRDLQSSAPSCAMDVQPSPPASSVTPSAVLVGSSQWPDQSKGALSSKLTSTDPKPRRRKKVQASNDVIPVPSISLARTEAAVASSSPTPTLVPVPVPACHATPSMAHDPPCSVSQVQAGHSDVGVASGFSEEILQKVADAKLHAEEATAIAATAINHCHGLWNQLAKEDSGMTQEVEAKIAAAAGAAAAAASVAKAATAAARVASNAALQAKLMAEEALVSSRIGDGGQSGNPVSNAHSPGSTGPASLLTGDGESNQSSSILVAAREAAKRRIEAATAAAKQAENLDAILKAAELAAEAVSQAGLIVAMGDPLALKELVDAGPEGYWKLPQVSSRLAVKSVGGDKRADMMCSAGGARVPAAEDVGLSGMKVGGTLNHGEKPLGELSVDPYGDNATNAYGSLESIAVGVKDSDAGRAHELSDMVQSNREVSSLGNSSGTASLQDEHKELAMLQGNIKEGSTVEVYKEGDGLKPAWFSASVVTVNDGKAFVHYATLLSKEDSDNLKEWVALDGEGGKAPRIRASVPMIASHLQGTRKRRRSATGNYAWSVGDMVDACIQDSWREGVVTEKNEKDETTLTVHFPDRGETSAVSSQQLRPSRIWCNGSWVEWSRLRGHDLSNESDMPLEKRPRLRSPEGSKEKDKVSGDAKPDSGKPGESKLLALSAGDKVFNVGKSTKVEAKPGAQRNLKGGLQKEGSRVVFGVPKPGKKRKFMEVSKHFSSEQKKENVSKDPVKFAKYLMPQGTSSRGLKSQSQVPREKQPWGVATSKSRSAPSRTTPQVGNLVNPKPAQNNESLQKESAPVDRGFSSVTDEEGAEGPLSTLFPRHSDASLKNSSSTKPEVARKRRVLPSGSQLTKIEEEKVYNGKTDKAPAEGGEPRRSNRRIQPTHRLLEGIQSSLIIPKLSSVSHDKGQGQKNRSRTAVTRGK